MNEPGGHNQTVFHRAYRKRAVHPAALNGGAGILVTGDKEMIELKKFGALQIVTPRQFWEMQKGQRHPSH